MRPTCSLQVSKASSAASRLLQWRGDAHTIREQLRQFNQMRNAEQFLSFQAFQIKRQVAAQRIGGGQVFVGKAESTYKHFRTSWLAQPKVPALTSPMRFRIS